MKFARRLLLCSSALAVMVAGCLALHAMLPLPDVRQVRPKIEFFTRHKDRYTTVFLGSSHVQTGVDPALFDRRMSEAGYESRSFNLAISGMGPPESFFMARRVLAARPAALKRIFIETAGMMTKVIPAHAGTVRAVYWHDWTQTAIELRILFAVLASGAGDSAENEDRDPPIEHIATHLTLMMKNYLNLGRATELLSNTTRARDKVLGPGQDGFIGLTPPQPMKGAVLERYRRLVERLRGTEVNPLPLASRHEAEFFRLAREARAHGVELILLGPPNMRKPRLFVEGSPLSSFSFMDPEAYPELYAVEHRADLFHLNAAGAQVFTEIFARTFAASLSR